MRLYLIHRKFYLAYIDAQDKVKKIVDEREDLLARVQPKSSLSEHVDGGTRINKAEEYIIATEQKRIKERLTEAKEILKEREELLKQKEKELRQSRDIYNVIYTGKWVDGKKTEQIVIDTGYSRSQVYNIMGHISKQIERF